MRDVNKSIFTGRLARDPETKQTKNGKSFTNINVAVNYDFGEKKEVSFFHVVCFGGLSDIAAKYMKKGMQVAVEARAKQESWEDSSGKKSRVVFIADQIQMLGSKSEPQAERTQSQEPDYDDIF